MLAECKTGEDLGMNEGRDVLAERQE